MCGAVRFPVPSSSSVLQPGLFEIYHCLVRHSGLLRGVCLAFYPLPSYVSPTLRFWWYDLALGLGWRCKDRTDPDVLLRSLLGFLKGGVWILGICPRILLVCVATSLSSFTCVAPVNPLPSGLRMRSFGLGLRSLVCPG